MGRTVYSTDAGLNAIAAAPSPASSAAGCQFCLSNSCTPSGMTCQCGACQAQLVGQELDQSRSAAASTQQSGHQMKTSVWTLVLHAQADAHGMQWHGHKSSHVPAEHSASCMLGTATAPACRGTCLYSPGSGTHLRWCLRPASRDDCRAFHSVIDAAAWKAICSVQSSQLGVSWWSHCGNFICRWVHCWVRCVRHDVKLTPLMSQNQAECLTGLLRCGR